VTDKDVFNTSYTLVEDLTQRANRAVARVDLPASGADPNAQDGQKQLLGINQFPEDSKLNRSNIRGVVFDMKTSPDFVCDDPDAHVLVVMQGPANWWMKIGTIPLRDAKEWQSHQLDITNEEYFKALPSEGSLRFVFEGNKPAKGSVYFDKIGFMVR